MPYIKRMISLLLCILTVLTAVVFPSAAAGGATIDEYGSRLVSLGFPEDYALKLSELHSLHPTWSFVPLMVSELNSKYTWDYVVRMETEDAPNRSLVKTSDTYAAYRHPTNRSVYDSGWYQASRAAVEYFLDPRNFLNEKDIFQFENIMLATGGVTAEQVEAALEGTFMAGVRLENGKTYAEYFVEVGNELGINPLHLASRARQEQGKNGTAAQISGACGDTLWYYYSNKIEYEGSAYINAPSSGHSEQSLKAYNRLYNFYNIKAAGTGRFAILFGAMSRAKTGTPSKTAEWGGSGEWNTRWKSIYGGAYELYTQYISNYQNTVYLQKWNVDARSVGTNGKSRNFWGQFMQHIGGALGEGRNSYVSLSKSGSLDLEFTFLIPVYAGMPASCPDPAGGYCGVYAMSDAKYSFINRLQTPFDSGGVKNKHISAPQITVSAGDSVNISGWSVHSYGVLGYEYSIDGGGWLPLTAAFSRSAAAAYPAYINCTSPSSLNSFTAAISTASLEAGRHTVAIRGAARFGANDEYVDSSYYLVAEIPLNIKAAPGVSVRITRSDGTTEATLMYARGSEYNLPAATPEGVGGSFFVGWLVMSSTGTQLLPAGAALNLTENLTVTPLTADLRLLDGASIKISEATSLRFSSVISYDSYHSLNAAAQRTGASFTLGHIICRTEALKSLTLHPTSLAAGAVPYLWLEMSSFKETGGSGGHCRYTADTPVINKVDYAVAYSAAAFVRVVYSDTTTAIFVSGYDPAKNSRSARSVATAALSDAAYSYSTSDSSVLLKIAGK